MSLLPLRGYQESAIKALRSKWDAGIWRPACVLPTGAGKTVVFAHLANAFLAANPGRRVLVLSHTDELTRQAAARMRDVAPGRSVGIVKAARREVHAEVISASVMSLRSESGRDAIRNVGLIIVDECHHAVAATYRAILRHYGALPPEGAPAGWEPSCLVAGFTATLVRGDKAKLSEVWEEVAFRLSIAFMIRSGYLLDVKGKRIEVPSLDLRQVKRSGGDYQKDALGGALIDALAPEIVAKAFIEHASDRKGIGFAPTVESAYAFADAFSQCGIATETVHGALPRDERRAILARLKSSETQFVWNCAVLTEGFDEPSISVVVVARPTMSAGLYQQMVGRVLRPDLSLPADQRGHALILDVTGVSARHDLRSLVDLTTREDLPEDVNEDLSLIELEDLVLEDLPVGGGYSEPEEYYIGPTESREFDPLGRDSTRAWGQTPDGHYYLTAGSGGYVFLTESLKGEPGTFDVIWCDQKSAGMTGHVEMSLEMALAWGEEEAIERGGVGTKTLTAKAAKWRKDPATSSQVWKVRRTGAEVEERNGQYFVNDKLLTKGEASALIDATQAASRIDPLVRIVKGRK